MTNGDQLPIYSVSQLLTLFNRDPSCKVIALKINQEAENTALHAIYIEQQAEAGDFPFDALVTVTEWDGKSEREEFFIEAASAELLMEKLQRFDEINNFTFFKIPNALTIDSVSVQPQQLFCLLFPELGVFNKNATKAELLDLKTASLALLQRLENNQ